MGNRKKRMGLQHLDRGQQRCCRNFAVTHIGSDDCLRIRGFVAHHRVGMLLAKCPAAVASLTT